jgi:hypothetical protein
LDDAAVADPVGLVVRLVAGVEQHLDAERIREVVTGVVRGRTSRRRLAQALRQHSEVLRTGRPPAALSVGRLLLALREAGAHNIAAPRCAECGRQVRYLFSRRGGSWGCSGCFDRHERCAGCGDQRRVVSRDRHGWPRCAHCPDTDGDTLEQLAELVTGLDPALDRERVQAAVRRATVRPASQHRLAWAVLQHPDLLTGNGHLAPAPAVLRFIDELVTAGAMVVARPACPRCHRVMALSKLLEGQRVCRACSARSKAEPCTRCGALREPAARDVDGQPLCPNCLVSDPANLEDCVGCGRRRAVAVRTPAGPRCTSCRPYKTLTCAICGRTAVCEVARATSQPWCLGCQQWWARCSGCGTVNPVRGGTRAAPLCARCVNPDPAFWERCPTCQATWQLSPRPCQRCILDQRVRELLRDQTGRIRAELAPLQQALTGAERPHTALAWLSRPAVRTLLAESSRDHHPITHETLDALPAGKTLDHLRSVLVATGALPDRDERLVKLERWIARTIDIQADPADRRVLHGYAVWHHLRRLRHRLGGMHATHLQALNVRCHVTAAANLLAWLRSQGRTLATCTQADLDRWATGSHASYRDETGHFVRWAVQHRHASELTFGTHRWEGPSGPLDTEKRWADARRLLHDTTLEPCDQVAGLLLVLYAQRTATISQLTTDHVHLDSDHVEIMLGTAPVVLPAPLADLVRELVATRRGHAAIGAPDAVPWLFPGGRPGQPISDDRLGQRLQRIGLNPRQDRSTALFTLATELPAAVLARMLGIHITVAVQWQQAAAGDWAAYAADVGRRSPRSDRDQVPVKGTGP